MTHPLAKEHAIASEFADDHAEQVSRPLVDRRSMLQASVGVLASHIQPGPNQEAHFSYSTDGEHFTPLGPPFVMNTDWQFFMGHRFAIFNYATQALGGAVTVKRFDLTTP